MADLRTQRRLAAILAVDVVGYSRLMGQNEVGTLSLLMDRRNTVLEPLVAAHQGRIFKIAGDGVLVEFSSAVNAIKCAVDVQERMAACNLEADVDRSIVLRIGINLGDVIVEGSDLYGDCVNIAARLEAIADPGGICVSDDAYRQVKNKTNYVFEDLGNHQLKNISEPVRIYRLTGTSPAASAKTVMDDEKPTVAVLPFANMSGDPTQGFFTDGITEDIITELSRFRSLFVMARNSSFQYREKNVDLRRVGRELGAQYIVEGSIRVSGKQVRVTAQLLNAATGNHIWAERYDREIQDIFLLQDELAHSIAATVGSRVETVGRERAVRLSVSGLTAYELILRGNAYRVKFTKRDNEEALVLFQKAISFDPQNARAHAYCAHANFMNYIADWASERSQALQTALEYAKRAVSLDEGDATARWVLGLIYLFNRDFSEARIHFDQALSLNPNDASANGHYALFLSCVGEADRAIEIFQTARRRDPLDPSWVPWLMGIAYFTARRYDEAISTLSSIPEPINEVRLWHAASLARAGRIQEATVKLNDFLRIGRADMVHFPGSRLSDWSQYLRGVIEYEKQADMDHFTDALCLAGFAH